MPIHAHRVLPSQDEHIWRMLDDHAWFRDVVFQLERRVREGAEDGALLGEVGRRLAEHARLEEREIFERMQAIMTQGDLADIAERSLAFRHHWRRPEAIGPPQLR